VKKNLRNSFRVQMLANVLGVLVLLVFSTGYILLSTIKAQEMSSQGFERQRGLRDIRVGLDEFQRPFLEYLSTKSSKALSRLLVVEQGLRGLVAETGRIPQDEEDLREREIHSLVRAYLDFAARVIEEKRGRDIDRYTSMYDEMRLIHAYIGAEIDAVNNGRFERQFDAYGEMVALSRDLQFWNLIFISCVSLLSACLALRAIGKMNGPLLLLSRAAEEISAGRFDAADVSGSSLYEIDHVVEAFNRMKRDIHTYVEELKWQRNVETEYMQEKVRNMRMEEVVRRMELYTLQAQMNPHFLFNTINTGVQIAIVEGAARTAEYMENLAKLFRHNLRVKDAIVPLRHEVEGLESYFYILRVRFPTSLDLTLDVPESLLDSCSVPASILQPLVENCVIHAFKDRGGQGSIIVRAELDGDTLSLSVSDDGCGMDARTVGELLGSARDEDGPAKVMGLENVIHRLRFFFPDDPDVVSIKASPGEGTSVLIRLNVEKTLCIQC